MSRLQNINAVIAPAIAGPDGVRRGMPHPAYIAGKISVFNDHPTDLIVPGTVMITGLNDPQWRAGIIPAGTEVGPIYFPGDVCTGATNYASGHVFLGVALGYIEPETFGECATAGSIVPVRCNDASVDTALHNRGQWVRWSANNDLEGILGCVESVSLANMLSATPAIAMPGSVVGQVIVPAGSNGVNNTGSEFMVIVRINPR